MFFKSTILVTLAALAVPAFADDCSVARTAMENAGHTPHSIVMSTTDSQGNKKITRTVQTVTDKYVQTEDGKWFSMGIAIKDLKDNLKDAKLTCRRSGSDSVNGESATIYEVHMETDGIVTDNKIWVSSKNLVLRSDLAAGGRNFSTVYDFTNVTPPANAISTGAKAPK